MIIWQTPLPPWLATWFKDAPLGYLLKWNNIYSGSVFWDLSGMQGRPKVSRPNQAFARTDRADLFRPDQSSEP